MKALTLIALTFCLIASSCSRVKDKAKETINEGGETVGKSASEFFEGVADGVEESFQRTVVLSPELQEKGLKMGKHQMGDDNKLNLYLIFDQDFNGTLRAAVADKNGLEYGRTSLDIVATAGDAGYYDFVFDSRTDIELKSVITIQ